MNNIIWRAITIIVIVIVISSLYSADAIAKTLRGYTENVEIEGFDSAYKAIQDQQGYIWFINSNGLHRYDGNLLKTFTQDDDNGLSNTNARAIHIDNDQTLWIGTIKGLNRYNPKTQEFTHVFDNKWAESKSLNIAAIISNQNNQLLITTAGHNLLLYDIQTNTYTSLPLTDATGKKPENNEPWDVQQDAIGDIWLSSKNGLYRLKFDKDYQNLLKSHLFTTENSALDSNFIILTYIDKQQNVWIATTKGLHYYHRKSDRLSAAKILKNPYNPLANTSISNFRTDEQGNLWISTWGNGVHILNKQQLQKIEHHNGFIDKLTLEFDSFIHGESADDDIQTNKIFSMLADNNGMMWIIGSGDIKKVLTSKLAVEHINYVENFNKNGSLKPQKVELNNISLPNKSLSYLFKDSLDFMWFGSLNGLARYHQQQQTIQYFYHEKGQNNSLPANQISTIFEDNQQQIWIGTHLGLARFNPSTNDFTRFEFYPINYDTLAANVTDNILKYGATDIIQDKHGALWIANGNRLRKYRQNTDEFEIFDLSQSNFESNDSDTITALAYDGQEHIWVGKQHLGLGRFNITTNTVTYFNKDSNVPNQTIYDFKIENKNKVWVASSTGLALFDASNTFKHFNEKSSNGVAVRTIQQDNTGMLWLGTDSGLKSFNPETREFKSYNQNHGLQKSDSSIIRASFKGKDGSLFFAGFGVDHFLPENLTFTSPNLSVILTEFLLTNRQVLIKSAATTSSNDFTLTKPIHFIDNLTLNHQQNIFSFEFNAFNYINPKQTRYQYRLKGFNDSWITADNHNPKATFTNIPSGTYQFEVKANTKEAPWSAVKQLNIRILPPWWQTKTAYLIYVLTTISLLWGLYRWRTKSIIATSLALEQQVVERTKTISQLMAQKDQMFANFSHEFRTPLTLILHPAEKLISNTTSDQQQIVKAATGIKQNAQRLLRMVEQLLEFAKAESNHQKLGLQHYSLKQTLNYLIACFDSLFSSKNLQVTVNDFQDVILSLRPDSLEVILTNLISNAVKFTPQDGQIDIEITIQSQPTRNTQVTIDIKDSGIGIAPEHQVKIFERFGRVEHLQSTTQASTGIGLALVKELVQANGGQIALTSALNQGSCFSLTFAIDNDAQNSNEISTNSKQVTALEISNLTQLQHTSNSQVTTPLSASDQAKQVNQPLILIIDDNQELLELISSIIAPHYNVKVANNGKQGVELATELLPDLVISDLMMPILDGFGVLKTLKSNPLTAHIPVVMLTAKGDAQSRIEGWNNQADEYLAKPFSDKELLARINNILAIRQLISQRFQQQFAKSTIHPTNSPTGDTSNNENKTASLDKYAIQFSQKLETILQTHYQDEQLNVATIANEMAMSQRQLIRKTKSILAMTPNESIRAYRLQKAANLLSEGVAPSTIAFEVGFASHSYFAACFKAQFGCTPSNYQKNNPK